MSIKKEDFSTESVLDCSTVPHRLKRLLTYGLIGRYGCRYHTWLEFWQKHLEKINNFETNIALNRLKACQDFISFFKSVDGLLGIRTRGGAAGWQAQTKPRSYGGHH